LPISTASSILFPLSLTLPPRSPQVLLRSSREKSTIDSARYLETKTLMDLGNIRMYDGSTPPNYSRFSSAVFVNVAL